MNHCLEDLSYEQGDPHDQQMSAHDPGGVNGTGSSSHDAGRTRSIQLGWESTLTSTLIKWRWQKGEVSGGHLRGLESPEQQAAGEALNFSPNRRKVTFPVTLWPQKKRFGRSRRREKYIGTLRSGDDTLELGEKRRDCAASKAAAK